MGKTTPKVGIIIDDAKLRDLVLMNLKLDGFDGGVLERGQSLIANVGEKNLDAIIIAPQIDEDGEVDPDLMRLSVEEATNDIPLILFVSDPAVSPQGFDFILFDPENHSRPFDPGLLAEKLFEAFDAANEKGPIETRNPLTNLPGTDWIDREIAERLRSGEKFSMVFTDLDNFRAYNKRYSYQQGDEVIKATAKLLSEALTAHPHARNFLGHRGSDDFVIITPDRYADAIGEKLVEGFDEMIGSFYEVQDLARGYVVVTNRNREEVKVPISTISAVIISSSSNEFEHPVQIYENAEELLEYAKSRGLQQSYCISEKSTGF